MEDMLLSENLEENIKEKKLKNNSSILEEIFEKYSKELNGYFPLQHPTGNGKTYHLENFLVKNIISDFKDLKQDRIIVITNNKININEIYRGIISKLKQECQEDKKDYIFQMKSVSDLLSDKEFLDEILNELDEDLKFYNFISNKNAFLKKFKKNIRILKEHIDKKVSDDSNNLLKEYIGEFKKYMFKFFKPNEKLKNDYKDITLPKFLYKLFPMIIDKNLQKKIYIMTTDKFLYGYIAKNGTEYFYEDYSKSLIFIDEIDSAKDKFLNFIKKRRTLNINNIIDVFNDRYNCFSVFDNNQLSSLLERLSKSQEFEYSKEKKEIINKRKKMLDERVRAFKKNGSILRKKYLTTRRYFELEKEFRIDLFENENHYVQSNGKSLFIDITNENCLITENETEIGITKLIDDLFDYSYNQFYRLLNVLYDYHMLLKEDDEVEKEIISHFIYNSEAEKEILNEYKNYYIQKIKIQQDNRNLMNKEYSYLQIVEANPDYKTNRRVKIGCQYMYITPEEFLYSICKENFVFGISATANIETCIGNFDIKWLKRRLKNKYYQMTNEEKKELRNTLLKINSFENEIERELGVFRDNELILSNETIGFKSSKDFLYKQNGTKLKDKIRNIVSDALGSVDNIADENTREYQKNCINYAAIVFLNFLLNEDTSSLLFISNRFIHKDILQKLAINLGECLSKKIYFKSYKSKELDEVLEASDNDENELMENLKDYKTKTIIFTTYQSAGVGVNIKYQYSKRLDKKLVKLDRNIQEETGISLTYKDIDEIALENKTNLISFEDLFNEKITLLYYSNLLLRNESLNRRERSILLNRFDDRYFKKIYKHRYDYVENIVGKLIQAIGRCNRTKVRCKKRNIYLDSECFEVIKRFKGIDRLFIKDFNFLLEEAFKESISTKNDLQMEILKKDWEIRRYFEDIYLKEITTYNQLLRNTKEKDKKFIYTEEFIKFYKHYERFRMYILKNPTRGFWEEKSVAYFFAMKKINSYTVIRSLEDKIDNILFNSSIGNVSKIDCRLDELKEVPLLKHIIENKVGSFEKNDEIILPYVYQAIFKGTLGEVVIKEIFRIYDIKLKDITYTLSLGILEIFDDISEGGMYIDYKNYNLEKINSREFFNSIVREKSIQKKRYIDSNKKLFIINLISNKLKIASRDIAFYRLGDIFNESYETCGYKESEVVVVSGILRYKENGEKLEINEPLIGELRNMLGGK